MAGKLISEFLNPLRQLGAARSGGDIGTAIDVFHDIANLEYLSTLRREGDEEGDDDGGAGGDPDAPPRPPALEANQFLDLEADDIRRAHRNVDERRAYLEDENAEVPKKDWTWAFNQATGARLEPRDIEIDNEDGEAMVLRSDGDQTSYQRNGKRVYTMNERLPSLNRQPGVIFVPAGVYHIFGTVTLFSGQQIIGVGGGPNGSVLVKVGDGACIRTQNSVNLGDDLDRSIAAAVATQRPYVQAELDRLLMELEHRVRVSWEAGAEGQARQLEELGRNLLSASFTSHARVRISSIGIRQQNFPARPPAVAPVTDALADATAPESGFLGRQLRESTVPYTSIAIDCVGIGVSILEDLTIRDFDQGVGINIRPRNPGRFQIAYYNQIRRCDIGRCDRGILVQNVLGFSMPGQHADEPLPVAGADDEDAPPPPPPGGRQADPNKLVFPESLAPTGNNANSTVVSDCRVHDFGRAGLDLRGTTFWVTHCTLGPPAREPPAGAVEVDAFRPCLTLAANRSVVYADRFRSDGIHVLMPGVQVYVPPPQPKPGKPAPAPEPGEPDLRNEMLAFIAQPTRAYSSAVVHCQFEGSVGRATGARIEVLDYRRGAKVDAPRVVRPISARSGANRVSAPVIELASRSHAPQSFWTSHNLLTNTGFAFPPGRRCRSKGDYVNHGGNFCVDRSAVSRFDSLMRNPAG